MDSPKFSKLMFRFSKIHRIRNPIDDPSIEEIDHPTQRNILEGIPINA